MRREFRITAAVIAFLVLITSVSIQVLANSQVDSRTQAETKTLDEQLAQNVEKYHIPGMAVVEVDSEGVIFEGTYGDCESVDQTFIIGSLSKSFTALAVMQLSEEGKVNIDAPISDYIDCKAWFVDGTDYERIRVRDLLNQTSGIETYAKLGELVSTDAYGSHIYANANYGLLGLIIESVSGVSYEEYINANVFTPLGMTHSYASYSDEMKQSLLKGNRNYFGLFVEGEPDYPGDLKEVQWTNVPGGYLSSSASDMAKYLQMYLRGGEDIIGKESIDKMFYENVPNGEDGFYGMGWEYVQDSNGEWMIQHMCLVENYSTMMYIRPEEGKAGIVLTNMNDYLVDDMLMGNVVAPLMGESTDSKMDMYMILHILIDMALLGLIMIAIYPVVTMKKWTLKKKRFFFEMMRHLVLPISLLVSVHLVAPLFVIRLFAKDVWFVLIMVSTLLVLEGIVKTFLYKLKSIN